MPDHENATCRPRARADCARAVDRPRRCDRVSRPELSRRRSLGRPRLRLRRQPARCRLRIRIRATRRKTRPTLTPSLRTTSGNVFVQTFGLPGFQLYLTTGGGIYRERLGNDQETAFLLNNGGGAKINLAGPLRARVDYRVFSLRGNPRHTTVQRIYAGAESRVLE